MARNPAMSHQTDTLSQPVPMPRHTYLMRRGSRYYFNAKVPQDLRGVLKKDIIRNSEIEDESMLLPHSTSIRYRCSGCTAPTLI